MRWCHAVHTYRRLKPTVSLASPLSDHNSSASFWPFLPHTSHPCTSTLPKESPKQLNKVNRKFTWSVFLLPDWFTFLKTGYWTVFKYIIYSWFEYGICNYIKRKEFRLRVSLVMQLPNYIVRENQTYPRVHSPETCSAMIVRTVCPVLSVWRWLCWLSPQHWYQVAFSSALKAIICRNKQCPGSSVQRPIWHSSRNLQKGETLFTRAIPAESGFQ